MELDLHFLFTLFSGDYFLSHSLSCTSNKENANGVSSVLRLHHHSHIVGGNRLSASRVWTPEDPRGANATSTSSSRSKRGT